MLKSLKSGSLEDRARKIVDALGGSWSRKGGMCCCPAHADRAPSLSITIGKRAILFHCFAGCTNEEVLRGMTRAGIKPANLFDGSGKPIVAVTREETPSRNALRLWREASVLAGSPGSGLPFEPRDKRKFARPAVPSADAARAKDNVRFLPALVAAVRNDEGILALHRTFLDVDHPRLASFEQPKRALGSLGSGAVRLACPRGGRLGLAEGVETALSAMQLFGIPCWAALGNERFGLVTIPETVRELHLFVDNDAGGQLAEERACEAYAAEGRRLVTRRPDGAGSDWNDVLVARQAVPG